MKQESLQIGQIPALLWGEAKGRLIVAIHGNLSHKADTVIDMLANCAVPKGYQVLSFDLPEHGDRKNEAVLCKVQTCVDELHAVMNFAKTQAQEISLFGCSIGAYFSLLAYQNEPLKQALFLSPVVNMERLIENMLSWFSIREERLQAEQTVETPIGQTLYWDDYQAVKAQPVDSWSVPTQLLYGATDNLCERAVIDRFAQRFDCHLTVLEEGEHFFHTTEQLEFYAQWLNNSILTLRNEGTMFDIHSYWRDVAEQNRERLREWFAPDAIIRWHNTNEQFTVGEFLSANCDYPGQWQGCVEHTETLAENKALTVTRVWKDKKNISCHVVSFFTLQSERILGLDEYWGDDGSPPQWRQDLKLGKKINSNLEVGTIL